MAPARPGVASPWGDPRGRGYHARRIHFAAGTHRCHPLIPGTAWFVTVAALYDRRHSLNLRKPAVIEGVNELAGGRLKLPFQGGRPVSPLFSPGRLAFRYWTGPQDRSGYS